MTALRVLITEDNDQSRYALTVLFEKHGWEAVQAETLAEGLAALDWAPDCLLLDLALPDGPGETILQKVREDNLPVRVVVVTTGVIDAIRLSGVASWKPDLLVRKPIDWDVILRYCESEMRCER
jgi:DNA-binding response OmpR family regulator